MSGQVSCVIRCSSILFMSVPTSICLQSCQKNFFNLPGITNVCHKIRKTLIATKQNVLSMFQAWRLCTPLMHTVFTSNMILNMNMLFFCIHFTQVFPKDLFFLLFVVREMYFDTWFCLLQQLSGTVAMIIKVTTRCRSRVNVKARR